MDTVRYATLAQARAEVKETGASAALANSTGQLTDDAYLLQALAFVSSRIDNQMGMTYAPHLESVYYDAYGWHIDDLRHELKLDRPFMTITAVSIAGTALTPDDDYLPVPRNATPIEALRIPPSSGRDWGEHTGDWIDSILVTGLSGFRRGYASAWRSSGDTVEDNPLAADAVEITVNDADGADSYGVSPRFSPGQLVRFGTDSDFREVLAVDYTTQKLSVRSSARGSTSTSQAQNTAIFIWQPEEAVQRACLRWTSYLYKRRGEFQTVTYDGVQTVQFPPDIPEEARAALDELPKFYVGEGV